MKKLKFVFALSILLLTGSQAFALTCQPSRNAQDSTDQCWASVRVASNETTLVSVGTVLVFDVANAQVNEKNSSFQVRVSTASANGVRVAGVAQQVIASGNDALILVRGRGDVAVNATDTITSGDAFFVGASGNATITTSTTQKQLGFSLENQTATGTPARNTKKAYITVV